MWDVYQSIRKAKKKEEERNMWKRKKKWNNGEEDMQWERVYINGEAQRRRIRNYVDCGVTKKFKIFFLFSYYFVKFMFFKLFKSIS